MPNLSLQLPQTELLKLSKHSTHSRLNNSWPNSFRFLGEEAVISGNVPFHSQSCFPKNLLNSFRDFLLSCLEARGCAIYRRNSCRQNPTNHRWFGKNSSALINKKGDQRYLKSHSIITRLFVRNNEGKFYITLTKQQHAMQQPATDARKSIAV